MPRFTTKTDYEWTIESVDRHGDIIESDFADTLQELLDRYPGAKHCDVALVRTTHEYCVAGSERGYNGVVDRSWAYVSGGCLAERFAGGIRNPTVPKRYRREFAKSKLSGTMVPLSVPQPGEKQ